MTIQAFFFNLKYKGIYLTLFQIEGLTSAIHKSNNSGTDYKFIIPTNDNNRRPIMDVLCQSFCMFFLY